MQHSSAPTMLTYIQETPATLTKLLEHEADLTQGLVELYTHTADKHVCLVACGSSKNAAECAAPFMRKTLGARVDVVPSATFVYGFEPIREDTLYVVISQSGCSTNSIQALQRLSRYAKHHPELTIAACGLTTHLDTELCEQGLPCFDWGCGPELVGYVTKGVVSLAAYLMLFALRAAELKGSVSSALASTFREDLALAPQAHEAMQAATQEFFAAHRQELLGIGPSYICGLGHTMGIAYEAALKLGETVKIPAMAHEVEEFAHGPNLQMTPAYSAFFIDCNAASLTGSARMRQLAAAYTKVSKSVYLIGADKNLPSSQDFEFNEFIGTNVVWAPELRPHCEQFVSLYMLPVFELLSYWIAEARESWNELCLVREAQQLAPTKTKDFGTVMPF